MVQEKEMSNVSVSNKEAATRHRLPHSEGVCG
jgi:hypothetical protein